jgi:hypothetical protein
MLLCSSIIFSPIVNITFRTQRNHNGKFGRESDARKADVGEQKWSALQHLLEMFRLLTNVKVFDKPLQVFSTSPMTGAFRDGFCRTGKEDSGNHTVAGETTLLSALATRTGGVRRNWFSELIRASYPNQRISRLHRLERQ